MDNIETQPKEKQEAIGAKPVYHKARLNFFQQKKQDFNDYLLDHERLKETIDWTKILFVTLVSAFFFAYGFRAFTSPSKINPDTGLAYASLISGGASGCSQIILRICQLCGYTGDESTITSICYFLINVPLFFLAWKKVGHKFAFVTAINVVLSSIFVKFIPEEWTEIFDIYNDFVARALIAGIFTGFSSGLAFRIGTSAGGMDVVTFAIAEKKST